MSFAVSIFSDQRLQQISVKDKMARLHNYCPQKRESQCCCFLPQYYYRDLFWASLHIFVQKNVTSQCNLHNKHITCSDQQVSLISQKFTAFNGMFICSTASSVRTCFCLHLTQECLLWLLFTILIFQAHF